MTVGENRGSCPPCCIVELPHCCVRRVRAEAVGAAGVVGAVGAVEAVEAAGAVWYWSSEGSKSGSGTMTYEVVRSSDV